MDNKADKLTEIFELVNAVRDDFGNHLPFVPRMTIVAALIQADAVVEAAKIQADAIQHLAKIIGKKIM